jgi:hypothetical protein
VRIDLDRVANAVAGIGVLTEEAMALRLDESHCVSIESNGMKTLYCHFFVPFYLPNEPNHRESFINYNAYRPCHVPNHGPARFSQ